MAIEDLDDAGLLRNICLYRDQHSFTLLFRRHWHALYQLVLAKTGDAEQAEDLVQEIFVHIWENSHKMGNILSVNGYLNGMARNKVFDYFRVSEKQDKMLSLLGQELGSNEPGAAYREEIKEREIKELAFETAVEKLPERIRQVYMLRARSRHSYKEIGEMLNIKPQTARNAYSKAVAMLYESTGNMALTLLLLTIW